MTAPGDGLFLVATQTRGHLRSPDTRCIDWERAALIQRAGRHIVFTTHKLAGSGTPDAEPASTPGGGSAQSPHHDIAPAWPPTTAQGKP